MGGIYISFVQLIYWKSIYTGKIYLVIIQYCEDIISTKPGTVCRIDAKGTHNITKKQNEKYLYKIIKIANFNHFCGKLKITGSIKIYSEHSKDVHGLFKADRCSVFSTVSSSGVCNRASFAHLLRGQCLFTVLC